MGNRKQNEMDLIRDKASINSADYIIDKLPPDKIKEFNKLKLTAKQRRLVKALGEKPATISDAGRLAGYKEGDDLRANLYRDIKNPKLIAGLKLYWNIGDKGLGELACGTLNDILTAEDSSYDQKTNASKLALQVAGKLKTVNYSVSASIPEDQIKDHIAKLLQG